jgi:hypothetical protein
MRGIYIGAEFSHDKVSPRAVIKIKTRVGPIKRWVDDYVPRIVDGVLRERVALVMPHGFRFSKDLVSRYAKLDQVDSNGKPLRKWADGKFFMALSRALSKYLPHEEKTKSLAKEQSENTHAADQGAEKSEAAKVQAESESVRDRHQVDQPV